MIDEFRPYKHLLRIVEFCETVVACALRPQRWLAKAREMKLKYRCLIKTLNITTNSENNVEAVRSCPSGDDSLTFQLLANCSKQSPPHHNTELRLNSYPLALNCLASSRIDSYLIPAFQLGSEAHRLALEVGSIQLVSETDVLVVHCFRCRRVCVCSFHHGGSTWVRSGQELRRRHA